MLVRFRLPYSFEKDARTDFGVVILGDGGICQCSEKLALDASNERKVSTFRPNLFSKESLVSDLLVRTISFAVEYQVAKVGVGCDTLSPGKGNGSVFISPRLLQLLNDF